MAWSLVRESAAQTTNGVGTLPSNSTAGNLLVAVVTNGSATALTAPSGWTAVASITNGTISEAYIWAYFNNPGGLSSFTFAGGSGAIQVHVQEYTCTNVAQVSAASATGTNTAGAVASVTVTGGAGTLAGDLVIAAGFEHLTATNVIAWTDPSGYTQDAGLSVATATNHGYGGRVLSAASGGAQSVTMTSSVATASATGWTGAIASFTEPAGGVTPLPVVVPQAAVMQAANW